MAYVGGRPGRAAAAGMCIAKSFWLTCDVVMQTFKERAAEIADHAHNPRGALGEAQDFLRGLDEMERQCRSLNYISYQMW